MPIELQNPSSLPLDYSVFYCWQDHLNKKHHRQLISNAISNAIQRIQDELPEDVDCILRLDHDTSGRAGSIEIANAILKKISQAQIVIADVTPTIFGESDVRKYPNPNVMLELGYAANAIGWNRLVCVYNSGIPGSDEKLKQEELPFDIRHRRINSYVCRADSGVQEATKGLEAVLVAAIRAIILETDRGEFDPNLSGMELKHKKDLRLLQNLMNQIHRSSIDHYVSCGQSDSLYDDCSFFWYGFDAVVRSSHFRFYDKELERLINEFWCIWGKSLTLAGYVFSPISGSGRYGMKPHRFWNEYYEKEVEQLRDCFGKLPAAFKAFLDHVHSEYPEIDMDQTDATAWENNLPYITGDIFKSEDEDHNAAKKSK